MEGYDVVTSEQKRIGRVVDQQGDYYIVEVGRLRASRHALPKQFATEEPGLGRIVIQMSRGMLCDSPKISGSTIDEETVAAYWGLDGG